MKRSRPEQPSERREFEDRVRELDRELDACFLEELAPALERARRSHEDETAHC